MVIVSPVPRTIIQGFSGVIFRRTLGVRKLCHYSLRRSHYVISSSQKRGVGMGEFNNIFKAPRQTRGYSQAHLSEALAISKSSI